MQLLRAATEKFLKNPKYEARRDTSYDLNVGNNYELLDETNHDILREPSFDGQSTFLTYTRVLFVCSYL